MMEEELRISEVLKKFEENAKWVDENILEIQEKYEGKTIVVKDRKIIMVKASLDEALKELESKGEDIGSVYIETIPKKAIAFIL